VEADHAAALRAADWLCLAAAPTFAIMALLAGVLGGARLNMLCSAAQDASLLRGMVPMYLLMSAFHSVRSITELFGPITGRTLYDCCRSSHAMWIAKSRDRAARD
jgi:hypothetical protein